MTDNGRCCVNTEGMGGMTLENFTSLLSSSAPAPGGGSAAGLCGSLGAALCAMVSNLTIGRKKYAEYEAFAVEVAGKAEILRKQFLDAIDTDTATFTRFSAAMALPKETEEQKALRMEAMQTALYACTDSPLAVMRLCDEAMALTESIIGRSNLSAASDIGVSALCLKAAVKSAWLNVLINLSSMKDADKRETYRTEGEKLLASVCARADSCYERIAASL